MATKELQYTTLEEIQSIHGSLVAAFNTGVTRPIEFRKAQLSQLAYMIKDNASKFESAFAQDLGRPVLESHLIELSCCLNDAVEAYNHVERWAKTERAPFSMNYFAMGPKIRKEPKGIVLIISPFNYPAWLCLGPMAGAIAAGNAVVIKPSEITPATSALLTELIPRYLDNSVYSVVNGAIPETTKLLELKWDHSTFEGNGRVATIVSQAAAKHLTPVTLEYQYTGKNPAFVDPKTDIALAAKRISWGKFLNCGQTCTTTDYILVPEEAQDKVVSALSDAIHEFYPDGAITSDSYSRIVSDVHFKRLSGLLAETKGKIVIGGDTDAAQKFIAPTVVKDVKFDDPLMRQEIFGPILPIIPVKDIDEAISRINAMDRPLAVYIFTNNADLKKKYFDQTQSGAAIANETVLHPAVDGLPFGGIGASGHGYHTGKYGFELFTHLRATLDSPSWVDKILGARYAPYTPKKLASIKSIIYPSMPPRVGSSSWFGGRWFAALLCVSVAVGLVTKLTVRNTGLPTFVQLERLLTNSGK
ncbi:aldehyde dehydrogenase [Schizopora paradoxa]|uniref:Aldehyde dehydrogenase n=1 Tax=Schizopora paradoxa TaxID=27342 RepID=A0A0H2RXW7_9AGAM|nr:aldehyde dehydrogenase [Schizopora paradoxa]